MQNKVLPDGSKQIEANELTFKNVDRHHSGTYVCTANNGYGMNIEFWIYKWYFIIWNYILGQEVKDKIHVEVEYSPEVVVEEYFIHATETKKVELVCNVHAHPKATVQWFKNSIILTDDKIKLEEHGHRHTLTIPSISTEDFGNYTCRAKNIHGEASQILEVSGNIFFRKIQ